MPEMTRRNFLKGAVALTTVSLIPESEATPTTESLPRRVLGRTGSKTSILGLGMAPMGIARCSPKECQAVVKAALDAGINYIDVAPNYGDAEQKLGPVAKSRREAMFLVTKVEEPSREGALRQIRESLKRMQTDYIDAVHLHNIGDFDIPRTFGREGAMEGLRRAKEEGMIRFFGVSGHMRPGHFVEALETDEIDLIMPAINYVDRHTYNFEGKVLPVAIRHRTAVVAMKVLGGAARFQYDPPREGLLSGARYAQAVRYALSLQGVHAAVIGVKNLEELRQALQVVRTFKPLTPPEKAMLEEEGRRLAREWGPHFGPVG